MEVTCDKCGQVNKPHISVTMIWQSSPHRKEPDMASNTLLTCSYCGRLMTLEDEELKKFRAYYYSLMPVPFQNLYTWLQSRLV